MSKRASLLAVVLAGGLAFQAGVTAQNNEGGGRARGRDAVHDSSEGNGQGRARGRVAATRLADMDADHDGVVTRAEWQGTDAAFRQHDTNADGVLSGAEVAPRPQRELRGERRDELVTQFTRADRDADGRLRRNEWTAALGSFEQSDANGDGMVTRPEFLAAHRDDVRNGVTGDSTAPATADLRRGTPAFQSGFDRGLADGRQAGKEDRTVNGGKWDLEGQRELEQADAGYAPSLGRRLDYQAGYRAGFRHGYAEGFGPL
jgi:hypothetical protein